MADQFHQANERDAHTHRRVAEHEADFDARVVQRLARVGGVAAARHRAEARWHEHNRLHRLQVVDNEVERACLRVEALGADRARERDLLADCVRPVQQVRGGSDLHDRLALAFEQVGEDLDVGVLLLFRLRLRLRGLLRLVAFGLLVLGLRRLLRLGLVRLRLVRLRRLLRLRLLGLGRLLRLALFLRLLIRRLLLALRRVLLGSFLRRLARLDRLLRSVEAVLQGLLHAAVALHRHEHERVVVERQRVERLAVGLQDRAEARERVAARRERERCDAGLQQLSEDLLLGIEALDDLVCCCVLRAAPAGVRRRWRLAAAAAASHRGVERTGRSRLREARARMRADEARHQRAAVAVDNARARGRCDVGADGDDLAVLDDERAAFDRSALHRQDARVGERGGAVVLSGERRGRERRGDERRNLQANARAVGSGVHVVHGDHQAGRAGLRR